MSITAQDFVDKLRLDLVDESAVTWTDPDLFECLNEAIRAHCGLRTDSYVINAYIPLVQGTVQNLPPGGIEVFDIFENEVSKRRVTIVDQELLDEVSRFWPADVQETDVKHFTHDPRDKPGFRVYPPNDGTGSVYATYGAVPDPVQASDLIPLADQHEPALIARALAAAYRRNTLRQDLTKVQGFMQQFSVMLGLGAQAENAAVPKGPGG